MQATGIDLSASADADRAFLSRIEELRRGVEAVQGKVWAQDEVLLRLKGQTAGLAAEYRDLHERAAAALEALRAAVPLAEAPKLESVVAEAHVPLQAEPAFVQEETLPSLPRETPFYEAAPAAARSPRLWLPYATLALAGLALSVVMPRLYARPPAAAPPMPAPEPLRAVMPIDFSDGQAAEPQDTAVSVQDTDSVMKLVYSYHPAGSRRTVGEILRRELDAAAEDPSGESPWVIQRADSGRFLVTLRPDGDSASQPVYEFEVDPARDMVQPSQETQADLESGPRLAARE